MPNPYTTLIERLTARLAALEVTYPGIVIAAQVWEPARLPTFDRWAIILSPPVNPWSERRVAIRSVSYVMNVDIYALVKNFDNSLAGEALFGTSLTVQGVFELVNDIKGLLRSNSLGGLLAVSHDEPGGDATKRGAGGVSFGKEAVSGFDGAGEFPFVHRAKIPYRADLQPFCHPPASD